MNKKKGQETRRAGEAGSVCGWGGAGTRGPTGGSRRKKAAEANEGGAAEGTREKNQKSIRARNPPGEPPKEEPEKTAEAARTNPSAGKGGVVVFFFL